jgi:glycosyltransferase involved in cell wall biosynthesis
MYLISQMNTAKKKKVILITSHLNGRAIAYEWIGVKLKERGYNVLLLHIDNTESNFEKFILETGITYKRITYSGKNKIEMLLTICKLMLEIIKFKPQVVHTHYFDANLLGLTAAWILRIPVRVYTRHTTIQRYRYLKGTRNFEKYFNRISTSIISISDVVTKVLMDYENVPLNKIKKVHHGFDLEMFSNVEEARLMSIKTKYNFTDTSIIIGSISRYDEWKGVEYTIGAFKKIVSDIPNAKLVLANACGVREDFIRSLLKELNPNTYIEIPFEDDVFALINTFDYFVHVPIDSEIEAFGQVYIEVMAASVPMICTLSGVAGEYIVDKSNAVVVDYQNSDAIYEGLKLLMQNNDLKNKIINQANKDIREKFNVSEMINKLESIYTC